MAQQRFNNKNSKDREKYKKSEKPRTEKREISPESGEDTAPEGLIIGRNPVLEALKAGTPLDTIFVNASAGGSIGSILRIAREKDIVIKNVSDEKLTRMCGSKSHQGIIASGACAEYVTVEDILAVSARKGTKPFIIVCDEIEDPHNLGAIIRTAESAGADGIIIPKRRSASLNATVFKTSAGAASWLPVARVANLAAALDKLKENGVWIYGSDASGSDYSKISFTGAAAIVIGSEGFGMGKLIREKCDFTVSLPMLGKITSLNASVAAGILMYEAVRQRGSE